MPERVWRRTADYSMVVAVAAVSYYLAQTAINSHRATLPGIAYLDCLNKLQTFDWSAFQGEKPSASETYTTLASREPVGS